MKIYTKTGDTGETRLYGGTKVHKSDPRVECYGTVDELNAMLGLVRSSQPTTEVDALCATIQSTLFVVGAMLACPPEKRDKLALKAVGSEDVTMLEQAIDRFSEQLPALTQFILPGGTRCAAELHVARTVCRRAERLVVALKQQSEVPNEIVVYLNRLGDLLFVLARVENQRASVPDIPWVTG